MAESRNPLLRQAFEEAARIEADNLVENIVFTEFDSALPDKRMHKSNKKRINFKRLWSVVLSAVIAMAFLAVGASGIAVILGKEHIFSKEWRESIAESIISPSDTYDSVTFDKEIKSSRDKFSIASLESEGGAAIILDYGESMEYIDVTAQDEGYTFKLESVTKAKKKHRVITSGSISDASAEYEWKVSDSYFAIIEIKRSDGRRLTDEEKDAISGMKWSCLITGYSPSMTSIAFRGNTIVSYDDEYEICYAVEITEMMPFAGSGLGLTLFEAEREPDTYTIRVDENGNMELKNKDEFFGALLKFNVDERYADEKYVNYYFSDKGLSQPERWFERYYG